MGLGRQIRDSPFVTWRTRITSVYGKCYIGSVLGPLAHHSRSRLDVGFDPCKILILSYKSIPSEFLMGTPLNPPPTHYETNLFFGLGASVGLGWDMAACRSRSPGCGRLPDIGAEHSSPLADATM